MQTVHQQSPEKLDGETVSDPRPIERVGDAILNGAQARSPDSLNHSEETLLLMLHAGWDRPISAEPEAPQTPASVLHSCPVLAARTSIL